MRLNRNPNAPRSLDIWRRLRIVPGAVAAVGAIACSCSTPGEHTAPDTTSAPAPTISQEQAGPPMPECILLEATMVKSDPATYRFRPAARNLEADHVLSPTAFVVDFGDGSDPFDSSDFGLSYEPPVDAEHEFPESSQEQTYRVTSGIRMHVMDEERAPRGVEDGAIIDCPVREITVAPSN